MRTIRRRNHTVRIHTVPYCGNIIMMTSSHENRVYMLERKPIGCFREALFVFLFFHFYGCCKSFSTVFSCSHGTWVFSRIQVSLAFQLRRSGLLVHTRSAAIEFIWKFNWLYIDAVCIFRNHCPNQTEKTKHFEKKILLQSKRLQEYKKKYTKESILNKFANFGRKKE